MNRKFSVFSFQFSVFSFQFSVFSFQFSVFSFQFSVFSFQCSVGSWQGRLRRSWQDPVGGLQLEEFVFPLRDLCSANVKSLVFVRRFSDVCLQKSGLAEK